MNVAMSMHFVTKAYNKWPLYSLMKTVAVYEIQRPINAVITHTHITLKNSSHLA